MTILWTHCFRRGVEGMTVWAVFSGRRSSAPRRRQADRRIRSTTRGRWSLFRGRRNRRVVPRRDKNLSEETAQESIPKSDEGVTDSAFRRLPAQLRCGMRIWVSAVFRYGLLGAKTVAVASLVALVGFGGFWAYRAVADSSYFDVSSLRIEGVDVALRTSLEKHASDIRGHSIFRIDLEQVRERFAANAWVKNVSVHRELPATLRVDVTPYKPVAAVLMGHLYLVDGDGKVFKRATQDEVDDFQLSPGFLGSGF